MGVERGARPFILLTAAPQQKVPMKRFMTNLIARFTRGRQGRPVARKPVQLGVEGLEARDCPTTVAIAAYANALCSQVNPDINQLVRQAIIRERHGGRSLRTTNLLT